MGKTVSHAIPFVSIAQALTSLTAYTAHGTRPLTWWHQASSATVLVLLTTLTMIPLRLASNATIDAKSAIHLTTKIVLSVWIQFQQQCIQSQCALQTVWITHSYYLLQLDLITNKLKLMAPYTALFVIPTALSATAHHLMSAIIVLLVTFLLGILVQMAVLMGSGWIQALLLAICAIHLAAIAQGLLMLTALNVQTLLLFSKVEHAKQPATMVFMLILLISA